MVNRSGKTQVCYRELLIAIEQHKAGVSEFGRYRAGLPHAKQRCLNSSSCCTWGVLTRMRRQDLVKLC